MSILVLPAHEPVEGAHARRFIRRKVGGTGSNRRAYEDS